MFLYAILKGYKINVSKIIKKSILNYYYSNFRGLIPHPSTITMLCIMRRVKFNIEEEERRPKTPPLTLTAIIKPPSNKNKEKMKEIEEGRRESEQTEKAIVVSTMKRREEKRRKAKKCQLNLEPISRCQRIPQ